MNDERFDKLVQDVREESAPKAQIESAKDRVWQRLQESQTVACDELRPDLAAYAERTLADSRRLLIEDHLSRCVACRRALGELRGTAKVTHIHPPKPERMPRWARLAAAASIALAVLYVGSGPLDSIFAPSGPRATVTEISGTLYKPSGAPLVAGALIGEGEFVRTAAGSRAVLRLQDGTEVEMNQRTELSINATRSGETIRLERGDVIVEAAEQGRDRLRVVTRDSIASVKGTVFAVSSGTAGSLVSVVEGEVEVSKSGSEQLVTAGEQVSTTLALEGVGFTHAISWSNEANDYYALLSEFSRIESELAASTRGMRHQATMVDYLPRNVSAYFAVPNLDGAIADAMTMVDARAPQSQALGAWWLSDEGREMRQALDQMQRVTQLLGDELVVVMTAAEEPMPLFLAEIKPGAAPQLEQLIADMAEGDDPLPVLITDTLLMMADTPGNLALYSAELGAGSQTDFADALRNHYARGVGWLAALDVAAFNNAFSTNDAASRLTGLSSMRYLFVEQRSTAAGDESEATLSFDGNREGIASWIAAPGGIGSTEYLSADVVAASAGSTTDPTMAFDQLAGILGTEVDFNAAMAEFRQETGIDLRDDVAASLGTDFVIAIDGIAMGEPSWVAVAEVINPGALDNAVQQVVSRMNTQIDDPAKHASFTEEIVNGRTWRRLSGEIDDLDVVWTYDRGYMVMSTNEASALRAIATRDSSASLVRTTRFQQRVPGGGGVHSSGFFWLDLSKFGDVLATLGQGTLPIDLTSEPVLVTITGDDDSIRWASRARLTSLLFDLMMVSNE